MNVQSWLHVPRQNAAATLEQITFEPLPEVAPRPRTRSRRMTQQDVSQTQRVSLHWTPGVPELRQVTDVPATDTLWTSQVPAQVTSHWLRFEQSTVLSGPTWAPQ
jgi:hypothetical protein